MRAAVLILGFLLASTRLAAQADSAPPPPTSTLEVGETLLYDVKFGILNLGRGMMHIAGIDTIRGVPSLHVIFVLKGGPVFYRMHDRMDSWIGLDDFASRRFIQDFLEGPSYRYTSWEIFPDSGYYRQDGVDSLFPTSADPLDDYAFFYFVRTLAFDQERYEFDRYFRPDRNPVVLEVLGRDTLDLNAGQFATVVIHPVIQGRGILAEGKEARMWITEDDRRLMVQLKVKFSFATITLRLKEIIDAPPEELLKRPTEGSDP
jgi:hypothetical protein